MADAFCSSRACPCYSVSTIYLILSFLFSRYRAGGISQPKIIDCVGSDGKHYRQLVKGKLKKTKEGGKGASWLAQYWDTNGFLSLCFWTIYATGKDDLRQDAVMQQVLHMVNRLLLANVATRTVCAFFPCLDIALHQHPIKSNILTLAAPLKSANIYGGTAVTPIGRSRMGSGMVCLVTDRLIWPLSDSLHIICHYMLPLRTLFPLGVGWSSRYVR